MNMQKNIYIKKNVEDDINKYLVGDAHKNAHDFIEFIFKYEINEIHNSKNNWYFDYLGKTLIGVMFDTGELIIFGGDNDLSNPKMNQMDEYSKEKILSNINYCTKCNGSKTVGCGFRGVIFGKDYGDVCHAPLWFVNPDTETLESIKKLVDVRKQIIDDKQCTV